MKRGLKRRRERFRVVIEGSRRGKERGRRQSSEVISRGSVREVEF
jgi:hypothetical protein